MQTSIMHRRCDTGTTKFEVAKIRMAGTWGVMLVTEKKIRSFENYNLGGAVRGTNGPQWPQQDAFEFSKHMAVPTCKRHRLGRRIENTNITNTVKVIDENNEDHGQDKFCQAILVALTGLSQI